jgi:hypothetical protein
LEAQVDHLETGGSAHPHWNGEFAAGWLTERIEKGNLKPCRALVLSGDMVEETLVLSAHGFRTVVVDDSRDALSRLQGHARSRKADLDIIHRDLLQCRPTLFGPVELIYDRVFFHRLVPARRAAWAHVVARLLPKGGRLMALFRIGRSLDGPPYPITLEALEHGLKRHFMVENLLQAGPVGPGEDRAFQGSYLRK